MPQIKKIIGCLFIFFLAFNIISIFNKNISYAQVASGWEECNFGEATYSEEGCRSKAMEHKNVEAPTENSSLGWYEWAIESPSPLSGCTAVGVGGENLPKNIKSICEDGLSPQPSIAISNKPSVAPAKENKSWYKLQGTSFSKIGSIINYIPDKVLPFDSSDRPEPSLVLDLQNEDMSSGVVTSSGSIEGVDINNRFGYQSLYSYKKGRFINNIEGFLEYSKSKKTANQFSNTLDIKRKVLNFYIGNLHLSSSDLPKNKDNYAIFVRGDVTITQQNGTNIFNNEKKSIAILSTGTITIDPEIEEINGIFIADYFDFSSSNKPLKIYGNIISNKEIEDIKRERSDSKNEKPSLFIVFSPKMYTDLLDVLSITDNSGYIVK